ncbi:MAG: hypothetical protein IJ572_01625 [Bacilli bacterium]|nr:hypothetical protein [Bacilli bacterium]
MKRFFSIKNVILTIFLLLFTIFSIIKSIEYNNSFRIEHTNLQQEIEKCNDNTYTINDPSYSEYCSRIKNLPNYKEDFFSTLSNMIVFDFGFLNPFAFLILIIPSLIYICDVLRYKYIINSTTRTSYHSFLKHFYINSFKYIWILPVIALIIMIPICFYTTFDPSFANFYETSIWNSNIIKYPFIFILLYLVNIILYSISFINISLIIARKQHNYIKAIILSYITYIGIELFFELIVNELILKIVFNVQFGYLLNIMNLFTFNTQYGVINLLLFSFIFCISTFIILILKYKNKEKLIIDCEKNN